MGHRDQFVLVFDGKFADCLADGEKLSLGQVDTHQHAELLLGELHILNRAHGRRLDRQRIDACRHDFELTDVAGLETPFGESGNAVAQLEPFRSEFGTFLSQQQVGMRRPNIAHGVQSVLDHLLRKLTEVQFRRTPADWPQPDRINGLKDGKF